MAPQKSWIWNYFAKNIIDSSATCKFCNKKIKNSGNTTNLWQHLKIHKISPNQPIDDCSEPKRIKHVNLKNLFDGTPFTQSNIPTPSTSTSTTNKENETKQISILKSIVTQVVDIKDAFDKVQEFAIGGGRHNKISDAIVRFICVDNRPFNIVEGEGFLSLLKEIAPLYKCPSREVFKRKVDEKYDSISNLVKDSLKSVQYITLTVDIWSEMMELKSFLGITAHYAAVNTFKLTSLAIGVIELTERHTSEYISEQILKLLEDWDISWSKIVACVTKNEANIVKAVSDTFGKEKHITCFAHTLNLVAERSMAMTQGLLEILAKVREIVNFFKKSIVASDNLRKIQDNAGVPCLKVVLDVKTRWNSSFYMLTRFIQLYPYINEVIILEITAPPMLSDIEIQCVNDIIATLKPLEIMTRQASSDKYISVSKIIPMFNCVKGQYDKRQLFSDVGKKFKKNILDEISRRFGCIEQVTPIAIATILDPRFKNIHFKDVNSCAAAITNIKKLIEDSISASSPSQISISENEQNEEDFWDVHKTLIMQKANKRKLVNSPDELALYLAAPTLDLKGNPFEAWNNLLKAMYPSLHKVSQAYLTIVASSVPSDRLFSKAGATLTQQRNRLTGKRLNKLLFLNSVPQEYWE